MKIFIMVIMGVRIKNPTAKIPPNTPPIMAPTSVFLSDEAMVGDSIEAIH